MNFYGCRCCDKRVTCWKESPLVSFLHGIDNGQARRLPHQSGRVLRPVLQELDSRFHGNDTRIINISIIKSVQCKTIQC